MSWINLGEVLYLESRRSGEARAAVAIEAVRRAVSVEAPTAEAVVAAARVKARHQVSYADAFAVATALERGEPLMTGDPEILALGDFVSSIDLRAAG